MISNPGISLRGLRTFCVAARHLSFRAASEELYITPSAVSHQIKNLERQLGTELFERSGRALSLSEIGRSLYADANPLIERLDAVIGDYRERPVRSLVRLSVQPFFASELFVPRLSEFTSKHPEIDLRVGTSDESAQRHPSDADLSIRLFQSPPPDMLSDRLFPLRLVPAASPEFASGVKVRKDAIVSEFPMIVHETRPRAWERWSREAGIRLPEDGKVIRLDSMIAAVRAAERGIGALLVPVPLADKWFQAKSLVRLFDHEFVSDVSYYLVCDPARAEDDEIVVLRDWILQNFAEGR